MLKSEVRVIELLEEGKKRVKHLAKALDMSVSWVSELVKSLEEKGIATKKKDGVELSRNAKTSVLLDLADRYDLYRVIGNSKEKMLMLMDKPVTKKEIELRASLSSPAVYNILRDLMSLGVVKEKDGKIVLKNESLRKYVDILKREEKFLEPGMSVIYSNSEKLVKVPAGKWVDGAKTAFSRFDDFGVKFFALHDYYVMPRKKVSIEEILIHAIAASKDKKEMFITLVFYLKNKDIIDPGKVTGLSDKYSCAERWAGMIAFLDGRELKNAGFFYPFKEFRERAAVYGVRVKRKYRRDEISEGMEGAGRVIRRPLNLFVIGGFNLILRGIKGTTKDIDIVVENESDFAELVSAFQDLGYRKASKLEPAYKKIEASIILEKEGKVRIDIFTRKICNAFILSENMKNRSVLHKRHGKLSIRLASLEDVVLFKSITDREGDMLDIKDVIGRHELDWPVLLEELVAQEKLTGRYFSFSVLDTLEMLQELYGMKVPIFKKLDSHCLEVALLLSLRKSKTIKDLRKELDIPEYQILNKLRKMEREHKIKVVRGGKLNKYTGLSKIRTAVVK